MNQSHARYNDPSPCESCSRIGCKKMCPLWRAWYAVRWRETRGLYGIESAADDYGMTDSLAWRLRCLRLKAGLSQAELADLCGLSHSMISAYEIGKSMPTQDNVRTIASVLHVMTDQLLQGATP